MQLETKELKNKIILKNKKDKPVTEEQDGFLVESKLIKTEKVKEIAQFAMFFHLVLKMTIWISILAVENVFILGDGREERWLSGWRPKKEFENG